MLHGDGKPHRKYFPITDIVYQWNRVATSLVCESYGILEIVHGVSISLSRAEQLGGYVAMMATRRDSGSKKVIYDFTH